MNCINSNDWVAMSRQLVTALKVTSRFSTYTIVTVRRQREGLCYEHSAELRTLRQCDNKSRTEFLNALFVIAFTPYGAFCIISHDLNVFLLLTHVSQNAFGEVLSLLFHIRTQYERILWSWKNTSISRYRQRYTFRALAYVRLASALIGWTGIIHTRY
jgi:hypothetical protein